MEEKTIQAIPVMPFALMFACIGAVIGLLVGIFYAFVFGVLSTIPSTSGTIGMNGVPWGGFSFIFGIGAIVITPIIAFIGGLIGGLIIAALYNFLAPRIGGIKLRFKEGEPSPPT